MRTFRISTDIAAPPGRVWEVMTDTERWSEWTPSITRIRRLDSGALAVGSRALINQPRLPPAKWTVTSIDPGRNFTWVSPGLGFRAIGSHGVEATAGGSRATLLLELQGPLGGLWGRLLKEITLRYITFEANGLKARSEDPSYRHDRA